MWEHNYQPIADSLGMSAMVAVIPIVVLFVMLGALRKPAWMSALTALGSAFVIALAAYGMPVKLTIMSTLFGAAFGLFPIAWIVFSSIFLYRLAVDTGKFEIIKGSIGGLTDDRRLQALFIAFSFGAFIEGAAGFGAPVAVSGAMLAGLGFDPFFAAGMCLLANTAPVAFGSIGIPVITLANVTGLPVMALSAMVGRLCAMMSVVIPGYLIVVAWGAPTIKNAFDARTHAWLPGSFPKSPTVMNGLFVPGLHNLITRVPPVTPNESQYAAVFTFNWLTASGTACFLATLVAAA